MLMLVNLAWFLRCSLKYVVFTVLEEKIMERRHQLM